MVFVRVQVSSATDNSPFMHARVDNPGPRPGRKVFRRVAGIAIATAGVIIAGLYGYKRLDASGISYDVEVIPASIPADGSSSAVLEIRLTSRFGNSLNVRALEHAPRVEILRGVELVRVLPFDDSLRYRIVPYFATGTVEFRITIPGAPAPIEAHLDLTASLADLNRNGYPDILDLSSENDRAAFRRWFTTIALSQLTHLDDGWHDRDCAGLVRYCYREALKKHDSIWLSGRKWLLTAGIPDVRKYSYPNVPLVGTRIFNAGRRPETVDSNVHDASDQMVDSVYSISEFSAFAEAARLKDNSMMFLTRTPDEALPGDMMVYLNDTESDWPYHLMIYLGGGVTVYHTGPDGDSPGRVKRLSLGELASHPNARWHPVEQNRYFLGFYRWRILA